MASIAGGEVYPPQGVPRFPPEAIPPDSELVETDGEPMDSCWHRAAIGLLIESLTEHWRDRDDFFVGGNLFVYFSPEQARNRDYRGPDFFVVRGVPRGPARHWWAVWHEGWRYPDFIIELASPSTQREDHTTKRAIYEQVFHTREYVIYDPDAGTYHAWRLTDGRYEPIAPDAQGRYWIDTLGLWLGTWVAPYAVIPDEVPWPRFFTPDGRLVLIASEAERRRAEEAHRRAEAERQRAEEEQRRAEEEHRRAEAERRRAEAAEAELSRLRAAIQGRPTGNGPAAPPS
jgi:Uma2 family endonuclease